MRVEVQDVGLIDFPDDAKPDEIASALNKRFPKSSAAKTEPTSEPFGTRLEQDITKQLSASNDREKQIPEMIESAAAGIANIPARAYRSIMGTPRVGVIAPDETGKEVLTSQPKPLPFQAGESFLKPRGTVIQPEGNPLQQLVSGFLTPGNAATFPFAARKEVQAYFLNQVAPAAVQSATKLVSPSTPPDQRRQAATDLLISGIMTHGLARGIIGPKTPEAVPGQELPGSPVQGPPARGNILATPKGATPPPEDLLADVPRVPMQGIPAPSIPDPIMPKNRPVVPGTEAEPYETASQQIKRTQAKTIKQIQQLFPMAELTREQARVLRNQAWGKPPESEKPNASQIQTPATVHGDVREQPGPVEQQVPAQESGQGIQPQPTGRLPENAPGEVPLTPEPNKPKIEPLKVQAYEGAPVREIPAIGVFDTETEAENVMDTYHPDDEAQYRKRGDKYVVYAPETAKPIMTVEDAIKATRPQASSKTIKSTAPTVPTTGPEPSREEIGNRQVSTEPATFGALKLPLGISKAQLDEMYKISPIEQDKKYGTSIPKLIEAATLKYHREQSPVPVKATAKLQKPDSSTAAADAQRATEAWGKHHVEVVEPLRQQIRKLNNEVQQMAGDAKRTLPETNGKQRLTKKEFLDKYGVASMDEANALYKSKNADWAAKEKELETAEQKLKQLAALKDKAGQNWSRSVTREKESATATPVETPITATTKVADHIAEVKATEGQRPARDVKAELLKRIEDAMHGAPEKLQYEPGKHGIVEINIPGDGNFKVRRNLEDLSEMRSRVKQLSISATEKPSKLPSDRKVSPDQVIAAYGTPEKAYQTVMRQAASLEDAAERADAREFADKIYKHTKAAELEAKADLAQQTAFERKRAMADAQKEIDRIMALKKRTTQHLETVATLKKAIESYKERMDFFNRSAEKFEQDAAKEKAKLGVTDPASPEPGQVLGFGSSVKAPPQTKLTPERQAALSKIGNDMGVGFDGVFEYHGVKPFLSFTFKNADKGVPEFGATFSVPLDATAAQVEAKAKQVQDNFRNPKPEQTGAGVQSFGGGTGKTVPPVATTPQQLSTLISSKTPGLAGNTVQGIQSLMLPTAKSAAHLNAAEMLGAKLGAMNHRQEAAASILRPAGKAFDRLGVHNENLPPDKNPGIKFMSDMSQGRPLTGPFQAIADRIQKLFGERLVKLEEAGAPLQTVRDNYFPGMWTTESRLAFNAAMEQARDQGIIGKNADVNSATPQQKAWVKSRVDEMLQAGTGSENDMLAYFTRSPLKGKESFRKQKVFDDIMTAAEFGLRPISKNPVDLVKGKLAEMDKSIMANQFFQQLKQEGKLKVISPYEDVPDGWQKVNDKYGTIYGKPTVTVPEYIDKSVYEGLLKFAGDLGIRHERSMRFPPGPGTRALGLSYQGQDFVRTRFATETSVLAHEIGHQLDYRYGLWNKIVRDAVGIGKKGERTKGASQVQRGQIKRELRAIADMTGSRGGDPRSKPEQIAQMVEAYVHASDEMKHQAPNVFKAFDHFIQTNPKLATLSDIRPGIELKKLTGEKYVGLPIMGYRIVPDATGDILNNYLSSSLYNNKTFGPMYKSWMGMANALNQSQLGMGSAFHAGFTTGDVQVSAGANLIKDIYGVVRGSRSASELKDTAKTWTVSSIKTAMTGDKVLNAWRNPDGVIDPRIAQVVKATELAGGGYKMEHGLQTEQTTKMVRDWFAGNRMKAAARSPIALTELMAKPIMDFLVPRQKAGVFSELAWRIIEQNPGKPLEELTPEFRQAWNRVDSRLGQVRYNRLFANNTAKNIVQGIVRAPGWTGGTIAEIGGAFPDAYRFLKEWKDTGKLPQNIPDRVAYTMSLLMTVATVNGVLTYALTGQTPTGMDFLAFRTGRKDKDGNDERFLLPTYVKDILSYAKQPLKTIGAKSHPLLSLFNDVAVKNQDYYGYEIRNPNASKATQAGQVAKYVVKSFEPFWIRGAVQGKQKGTGIGSTAAAFVGIMPAPAYVTRSSIQNEISELFHSRTGERLKPYDSRTADETKRAARDSSTMDIYMFKRLPQSDKDALRKKMSPAEIKRYFGGEGAGASLPAWARTSP